MSYTHRTVCKGFLLDERDVENNVKCQLSTFDLLSEAMDDLLVEEIGWPDYPTQNVIAIASERFDTGRVLPGFGGAEIVRHEATWNDTIATACCRFGGIDRAVMDRFLVAEDVALLSKHLKAQLFTHLKTDSYDGAHEHLSALENLQDAGLPCFQPLDLHSRGGGTGLFDARSQDFGTGMRVLVEILQTW